MVRKNKGRQKIEMVKMKNENNLQVTFSKRRSGLFRKGSELCTLCSADIAIIVFSPGRKVFSFGHPNVGVVIDRFLNPNPPHVHHHNDMQLDEIRRNAVIQDLNNHLTEVSNQLEAEKKKNKNLKQKRNDIKQPQNWWEEPIEELNLSQLTTFKCGLENLRKTVATEASKCLQANVPRHNFVVGSSSNATFGNSGDTNIKTELDLSNHQAMVNMNTFNYNHNMIVPNHTSPFGNYGDNIEGFVPEYNINYKTEYNPNQTRFKQEHSSEYDHHPALPPHFGHGYY